MQRRLALTVAATAAAVVLVGGVGVVANLGILGAASGEPVGQLDADNVAGLGGPVTTVDAAALDAAPTTASEPPPVDVATGDDVGSGTGTGGTGSATDDRVAVPPAPTTVAPPPTVRTDNSGPGSIDDSSGRGSRSGSGSSGSGSSGSGSSGSGSGSDDHYDD